MPSSLTSSLHYLPPLILISIICLTFYQTLSSPDENQKSKLLETLLSNILRYVIPTLLLIKTYNKQSVCLSTLTIILLSILSSFKHFSKGFRLATILIYIGYSYNCLFCPISSHMTYWFDLFIPILLVLLTKMKYDRGEKIVS